MEHGSRDKPESRNLAWVLRAIPLLLAASGRGRAELASAIEAGSLSTLQRKELAELTWQYYR